MAWVDLNIDAELMATLIDHRVSLGERVRAVRLLAQSDEAAELFATALRARRDAARADVVPIVRSSHWRTWTLVVPLAAAVLATVLLPRLTPHEQRSSALQYASALTANAVSTPGSSKDWEPRQGSVTRGGTAAERSVLLTSRRNSDLTHACWLGVSSVDLQVLLGRGDTLQARRVTIDIIEGLGSVRFSGPVAAQYTWLRSRLATDPLTRSIQQAASAEEHLRVLLDSSSFAFGQWIRAAQLAARSHNASFFSSDLGSRGLRSPITAGSITADEANGLRSIATRLQYGPSDAAFDQMHRELERILQRCGG